MKTVKIDFKEVIVLDLFERPILLPDDYQIHFGNNLYVARSGVAPADLGKKIFYQARDKNDLMLSGEELQLLMSVFPALSYLDGPMKEGIEQYLQSKLQLLNNQ